MIFIDEIYRAYCFGMRKLCDWVAEPIESQYLSFEAAHQHEHLRIWVNFINPKWVDVTLE